MFRKKEKTGKARLRRSRMLLALGMAGLTLPVVALAEDNAAQEIEYELEPVIVTASRIPEKLIDTKADVSVVSRKQIEAQHMQTVEEALRTVPGTQFLNYGANGINANLSGIRINGSKDVVILVDGVRMTDFQGANNSGYMYASILNQMDNIERVEVLRGSAGVMYGSGARGGVINIITRKADRTKQTIDMSIGSGGRRTYRLHSMGRFGPIGYSVYYNQNNSRDTKDGAGKTWPGRNTTWSSGFKISYDWDKNHDTSISYDKTFSRFSGQDFIYENLYQGDYESQNLTLRDRWQFHERWTNEFSYRHSDLVTHFHQGSYAGKSDEDAGIDSTYYFFSEQLHFSDSSNELVFGVDYSKGINHLPRPAGFDKEGNPISVKGHFQENYSFFIQNDWKFLPGWTLNYGLRHDRPESDAYSAEIKNHTSKSWKLSVDLTDKDTLYGGRSDFYILPGIDEIYASWKSSDGVETDHGNRELLPAEGWTETIGYTHKFSDASALTFNWFKTKSTRSIGWSDTEDRYVNYENGIARGWNLQFVSRIGKHWNLNVGWAHLYQNVPGDNFSKGYYPKDKLTFDVVYTKDKWQVGLDGFYFIRRENPAYAAYKGWPDDKYGIYNLSVNYSPNKELTVYTKIDNIFDTLWAEHTDVIWRGKPGSWYSMPGRIISVGARWSF